MTFGALSRARISPETAVPLGCEAISGTPKVQFVRCSQQRAARVLVSKFRLVYDGTWAAKTSSKSIKLLASSSSSGTALIARHAQSFRHWTLESTHRFRQPEA